MAIKKSLTKFIRNAEKITLNMGHHRPEKLGFVFTQERGCQDIYRKTGEYDTKILTEISNIWE